MTIKSLKTALLGTAIALGGLTACQSKGEGTIPVSYLEATPLDRHTIGVTSETEYLELNLTPGDTQLRKLDKQRLHGFIAGYVDRGHGPLIMSMPEGTPNPQFAVQAVAEAREIAWGYGVEYEEIAGSAYDAGGAFDAPLVLAYKTFEAVAPECIPLSRIDFADVSSNNETANFGCSIRANMAAMVADPADLLGERALDPGDVERRMGMLESFRSGEPTGAQSSEDESGAVATAVQE